MKFDMVTRWARAICSRNGIVEETGVVPVLGDPEGIVWLARRLHGLGIPLQAGETVLAGSFTQPLIAVLAMSSTSILRPPPLTSVLSRSQLSEARCLRVRQRAQGHGMKFHDPRGERSGPTVPYELSATRAGPAHRVVRQRLPRSVSFFNSSVKQLSGSYPASP